MSPLSEQAARDSERAYRRAYRKRKCRVQPPQPAPVKAPKPVKPRICLGNAPGLETWPEPVTISAAEKLARARLYQADLCAGREIRFVPQDYLLTDI